MTPKQLQRWRTEAQARLALRLGRESGAESDRPYRKREVLVCGGGACVSCGNAAVMDAFREMIGQRKLTDYVKVVETGCVGCCDLGVVAQIMPDNVLYRQVTINDVQAIVERHLRDNQVVTELLHRESEQVEPYHSTADMPFFQRQYKVVLENCGLIDPQNIEEYVARDGYSALAKALTGMQPAEVVDEVKTSGLRGRGGGGFATGLKWKMLADAPGPDKYIICNADEGDPGAFMDRSVLESDPHRVLEGMLIAGYATGARHGVIYVRAEYPLAIRRLQVAIEQAQSKGLLGDQVQETAFDFNIEIRVGAGAFVCGEETALMASVEGRRGQPRPRPPYPTDRGLYDCPTIINNVETFANIPPIIRNGGKWFNQIGAPKSPGTKVFALAGKIRNTGLVEVPTGTELRELIFDIGGGVSDGGTFKAAQTGGPSGGCIPAQHLDTPLDFDSLQSIGSIMGSGGLIVMDETSCMVDVARFFMEFCVDESCGKCPPCRAGTQQMLHMLDRICDGRANEDELDRLQQLAGVVNAASLCGLGMTAPNPVRSTLRHFRDEYLTHVREKRCSAGVCRSLFLAPCENSCPLHMNIPGFLQLLKENRVEEAFEMILLDNPLPAITGRVCQHPCQGTCTRTTVDEPVAIRDVHRHIADVMYQSGAHKRVFDRLLARKMPPTQNRVAVVGAGPAGLTAAFYLALLGHEVVLHERSPDAGGLLRYALPEYRIPRTILDKELDLIRTLGVRLVFNSKIGVTTPLSDLQRDHDVVLLALGTCEEMPAGVAGEDLPGVWHAISFLDDCAHKRGRVGRHVAVIGGGNSAIDAARTALRLGANVTVVYRRGRADMPAITEEVSQAEDEGVKFIFYAGIKAVLEKDGRGVEGIQVTKMKSGPYDASGRRRPVPTGEEYALECDTVIFAVGEKVEANFLKSAGIQVRANGTADADPHTLATNHPITYAAGDVVTGPGNVSQAMAGGKRAAGVIDRVLTGAERLAELFYRPSYGDVAPDKPVGGSMSRSAHLPTDKRKTCFKEVSLGLTATQARLESSRCLRCDLEQPEESAVGATSQKGE